MTTTLDHQQAAAYLAAHGFAVTPQLLEAAYASRPLPLPSAPDWRLLTIAAAAADWQAHVGEHDRSAGSGLDRIFKRSGWSPAVGVPKSPNAKIPDWCGMAVVDWLLEAGFCRAMNTSFLHVFNIEAFFTYGAQKLVNRARYDGQVKVDGVWMDVKAYHRNGLSERRWWGRDEIRAAVKEGDAAKLTEIFAPTKVPAVLLFDWSGINDADHVELVRGLELELDPDRHALPSSRVDTFGGNRRGLGPGRERWVESVVAQSYALNDADLYGVGHPSVLDFQADLAAR